MIFIYIFIFIAVTSVSMDYIKYYNSKYQEETEKGYFEMKLHKGTYGEYKTSTKIKALVGKYKTVFNAYIPKNGKNETCEIDIIIIHEKGIFVIENKNYSGWIFGSEFDHDWCETFQSGKRFSFYNPIKQNKMHIINLKQFLKKDGYFPFLSIITFNNNATLKKINLKSNDIIVTYSNCYIKKLNQKIKNMPVVLTQKEINKLYKVLKKRTQITEKEKKAHNKNIAKR